MKSDISKILNEAWRITFKNKWLWVFGLVLAITTSSGSGGGGGGNNSNSIDIKDYENIQENFLNPQEKITAVLNSTSNVLGASTDTIIESPSFEIAVVTGLVLLAVIIFVALLLNLYLRNWALASLIHGIDRENESESLKLSEMSKAGRSHAIEMIKLQTIPYLGIFLLSVCIFGPLAVAISLTQQTAQTLLILLAILLGIMFFLLLIVFGVSVFLGSISLVLNSSKWIEAFKVGFRIYKKYFIDVIILGCINCFLGGIVMGTSCLVIILIIAGLFGAAYGLRENSVIMVLLIPFALIISLILLGIYLLVVTVWQVFAQSTWVLLFKQLSDFERTNTQ